MKKFLEKSWSYISQTYEKYKLIFQILGGLLSLIPIAVFFGWLKLKALTLGYFLLFFIECLSPYIILLFFIVFLTTTTITFLSTITSRKRKTSYRKQVGVLEDRERTVDNLEIVEKVIIRRFGEDYAQLGELVTQNLKDYITTIPIKYDYLRRVCEEHSMIILYSNTTIDISEKEGRSSEIRKSTWFFPIDNDHGEIIHQYKFDNGTDINEVKVDNVRLSNEELEESTTIENNKRIKFVYSKPAKFPRFKITKRHISILIANCFTQTKEYWDFKNSNYPILFDKVKIQLVKQPKSHRVLQWNKNKKKWDRVKVPNQVIPLGDPTKKVGGKYTIEYFLNYQEDYDGKNFYKNFRVEWTV